MTWLKTAEVRPPEAEVQRENCLFWRAGCHLAGAGDQLKMIQIKSISE